jgi:predicted secreted protein
MATRVGKDGIVRIGSTPVTIAETREWQLETTGETTDSSSMNTVTSNGGWRTKVATLKTWAGSITCFWDPTDTTGQQALDAGVSVDLKLYPEGNTTGDAFFSGTAIVTGVTRSATLEGLVEAVFAFEGTGALTEAVAP